MQRACSSRSQDYAGKLGSLRKALKSRAELIFIDAPHVVEADQSVSDAALSEPRAWWTWQVSLLAQLARITLPGRQPKLAHRGGVLCFA